MFLGNHLHRLCLVGVVFLAVAVGPVALATDRNVPSQYATIQAAVNAAVDGDVVIIAPGIYTAFEIVVDKAITIRSTDPSDPAVVLSTIINCQGAAQETHTGLIPQNNVTVAGITIINAFSSAIDCWGYADLVIQNCNILHNGTGILVSTTQSGSVTVTGCQIEGNVSGGVVLAGNLYVSLRNCRIRGNSAASGAGIYSHIISSLRVTDCELSGNHAQNNGGAIYADNSNMVLSGCTLVGNSASAGGAIYHFDTTYPDHPVISNCILWANTAGTGHEIALAGDEFAIPNALTVAHSNVKGGQAQVSMDPKWTLNWQGSNVDSDPLYADADGSDNNPSTWADNNYHLAYRSPCVNAGDPTFAPASGQADVDGQPRVLYGRVDMGADEFLLLGDGNRDGYVNVGDLQVLVTAWGSQKTPPSTNWNADTDFNNDGYCNVGDLQVLVANWGRSI